MKFTNLEIKNFLTISEASIDLDDRGLILIQGENADDPSASSNGSGKSSIVDAICWALYGVTARDISGDEVVNNVVRKNCSVVMAVEDDGDNYRVERYRKHTIEKNALRVYKTTGGASLDLSRGTDRDTQIVVDKLLGCSLDVFVAAVYAGQEKMPDLPGATDRQLKLIVEEAAGVEELAQAYQEARSRFLKAEGEREVAQATLSAALAARGTAQDNETTNQDLFKSFETGRKDRARAILSEVVALQTDAEAKSKAVTSIDGPTLCARKGVIEAALAAHKDQQTALAKLETVARAAERTVVAARTNIDTEKARIERQKKELAEIDNQIGKPCGECGKAYHGDDLAAAKATRQTSIEAAIAKLRLSAAGCKDDMVLRDAANAAVESFKVTMTDVSAVSKELAEINNELATLAAMTESVKNAEKRVADIKTQAKAKLTETNPYATLVDNAKRKVAECEATIKVRDLAMKELADKEALLADCIKVFGPAGVRAHILDTVTPFLNERTSEYLGALADGNIHASWSTLTKTAKGELREKFNIDVSNDMGGKSFKSLSGGEKRKVRVATAMALQDMVASRATKPIRLFLADEIDHALDAPGLERLMSVLDKKAKECGTVMVVSHSNLQDWIDSVITVTKEGGVSTVSGATHHGF